MPVYRGKRDFPGRMLSLAAGAVARAAAILEAFHCVEENTCRTCEVSTLCKASTLRLGRQRGIPGEQGIGDSFRLR